MRVRRFTPFLGLNNRDLHDILIACVDGLTGFPEAINAIFPRTEVQLCVIFTRSAIL
jgi:transposase-like protein